MEFIFPEVRYGAQKIGYPRLQPEPGAGRYVGQAEDSTRDGNTHDEAGAQAEDAESSMDSGRRRRRCGVQPEFTASKTCADGKDFGCASSANHACNTTRRYV